jgi:hypothetical protein
MSGALLVAANEPSAEPKPEFFLASSCRARTIP